MDGSDVGRDVFVALRSFQNSSRAPRSLEDEDKMEIAQSLYDEGILAMFQENDPDKSIQTG